MGSILWCLMDKLSHISIKNLTHIYQSSRQKLTALKDINLEIQKGVFISIIGPSGAGKTTLLKTIGGLLKPTCGTIMIDQVSPLRAREKKSIGFVFQDPSLLPWKTVEDNLKLPLQLNSNTKQMNPSESAQLLETVGLNEFSNYYPSQLSGGMKQRLSFARALVINPSLLLLDEPLGALDEITRTEMRYELLRVWQTYNQTVILVTHSISEAIMMSDKVIVLSNSPGKILGEFDIQISRPRERNMEQSKKFIEYVSLIKEKLYEGTISE